MSNSDYVVGRAYGEMAPNNSALFEMLLKKAERERDHYKEALEEISTTIQEYKDSMVQEPAEDFIWAIKAWADKKLKEL